LVRVHQIAKELGWTSKQVIDYLLSEGHYVASAQSGVPDILVKEMRRRFAAIPNTTAIANDDRLEPTQYGNAAAVTGYTDREDVENGETWAQALSRVETESRRSRGRRLHPVVRALLDHAIVPNRLEDPLAEYGAAYSEEEIRRAKDMHIEWARGQLSGLPEDDRVLIEWIGLTNGQRPDLAAELAGAGLTPAEAGLRLGYGSRIDHKRPTIFTRFRNRQINRSETVAEVWRWRRRNIAS
jgi:hypothetical protein